MMKYMDSLLENSLTVDRRHFLETILQWGLPPLVIPALRWLQDPPELRDKLYLRDFITYSIGTLIFFGGQWVSAPFIGKVTQTRKLLVSSLGLAANLLFAGIGAIQLSRWLEKKLALQYPTPSAAPKMTGYERKSRPSWLSGYPTSPLQQRRGFHAFSTFYS